MSCLRGSVSDETAETLEERKRRSGLALARGKRSWLAEYRLSDDNKYKFQLSQQADLIVLRIFNLPPLDESKLNPK
ncbi:hypothetical protein [Planococcus shenhongbingii]|uniref:Uncharacterized protein n=1 Tax=Planococcus shenhongbingii TaxID=3058398 RepID=A0ABT8NB52_9BACL|nr:hypothetical protein [Planococcus sp. N017]MDN7244775.1 hypothetical protein [Planococcus sp. N017]